MITALGPRLGLGLRLDFGSQVWFVQYISENLVVVSPVGVPPRPYETRSGRSGRFGSAF